MSKRTNTPNKNPLFTAIERNDRKALLHALERVREVDPRGQNCWTPLMVATQWGRTRMVKILLEHGAKVNVNVGVHGTALHLAAERQNTAIVKLLLEYGADPEAVDFHGWTALERGVKRSVRVIDALLNRPPGQVACEKALARAIFFGNRHVVVRLLTVCVKCGLPGWGGRNILCKAAVGGHRYLVSCLVARNAPVSAQWEALVAAADAGHRAIVNFLWRGLQSKSNLVRMSKLGLFRAALVGQVEAVKWLLKTGANPREADAAGRTPFHWASGGHSWPVVRCLLEAGADLEAPDVNGRSPLYWAARSGSPAVMAGLIKAGANVMTKGRGLSSKPPFHMACSRVSPASADLLIAAGADVNCSIDGQSPLYIAVCNNRPRVVALLIGHGARVNGLQGQMRNSSLQEAAEWGFLAIVQQLIAAGAEINAKNSNGQTALDLAMQYEWRQITALLRHAGGRQSGEVAE